MGAENAFLLSAVDFVGTHALVVFLAALVLLLVIVSMTTWLLQRHPIEPEEGRRSVRVFLARLVMGFVVIVACAAVFAGLADEIDIEEDLAHLDNRFSQTVINNTPAGAVTLFAYITHLGDPVVLTAIGLVVAVTLFLRRQLWLAWGWVLAVAGNGLLNPSLKAVFTRIRPLDMQGLPLTDGWSFPSGHASGAVVTYGMLGYVLIRNLPHAWHLPVVLLAAALAFSIGWSRIFLQYHYGSDVLAGFASGSAWLAVCISTLEALRWQHVWYPKSSQP